MRRLTGALTILALLCVPTLAHAFDNDLILSDLGNPEPITNDAVTKPADPLAQERFARFAGEFALAGVPQPASLMATTGDAGFSLAFTSDVAFIHPKQTFNDGTISKVWPTEKPAPESLFLPTLRLRKGLPFSLELGADFTFVMNSSMIAASGVVKWALIEGFQWVPDIGVRAFVTNMLGTGALNVIAGGWDVGGSYRIPLVGGAELGVYGGYQLIGLNASTNNVDFNPTSESATNPISDDTVFKELPFGTVYAPSTRISRVYFGGQARLAMLVLGLDFSRGAGQYPTFNGSPTQVKVEVWKAAARIGVQF